jgi:hypothetical protein
VQYGHGKRAPGEVYSGSEKFLIGAGGSMFTMLSQQAPRPITLFLNDGVQTYRQLFSYRWKRETTELEDDGGVS